MLSHSAPPPPRRTVQAVWEQASRRLPGLILMALAAVPLLYVLTVTEAARRNVAYWDEIDVVLPQLIQLHERGLNWEWLGQLFAVSNEHRMLTSRLMYAVSYFATGTVDFVVFHWVGVCSLVAAWLLLIVMTTGRLERWLCAVLFGSLFFQLEHFESLAWSGASIDHFQVVALGLATLAVLARRQGLGHFAAAVGLAFLATFTLAHGAMIWIAGAVCLALGSTRTERIFWLLAAGSTLAVFLSGFGFNEAQHYASWSATGVLTVLRYWLAVLGSVPALGNTTLQPVFGAVLLLLVAIAFRTAGLGRNRFYFPLVIFAIGSCGLVAVGRAVESNGEVFSRYYVLSALAWGVTLMPWVPKLAASGKWIPALAATAVLLGFNVGANTLFRPKLETWIETRDRAASRFKQLGFDGKEPFRMHPDPSRATAILNRAEELGVYRMGILAEESAFPADAKYNPDITYFVDEASVTERSAFVRGWAAIPGVTARRGQVHLLLKSGDKTLVFSTLSISRPDVAQATGKQEWTRSGFRFSRRRDRLPTGTYQVGFLVRLGNESHYTLTAHVLELGNPGRAILATE